MSLKNILLKLEKYGFIVYHQVIDKDIINEIENIESYIFQNDVYGIIYYTYEDYIQGIYNGYITLRYVPLEEEYETTSFIKRILINNGIHYQSDGNIIFVEISEKDVEFMNGKINFMNDKILIQK